MSSLARPFLPSACRLMASSVLLLGSPTTSHQFSSLRPGYLQAGRVLSEGETLVNAQDQKERPVASTITINATAASMWPVRIGRAGILMTGSPRGSGAHFWSPTLLGYVECLVKVMNECTAQAKNLLCGLLTWVRLQGGGLLRAPAPSVQSG